MTFASGVAAVGAVAVGAGVTTIVAGAGLAALPVVASVAGRTTVAGIVAVAAVAGLAALPGLSAVPALVGLAGRAAEVGGFVVVEVVVIVPPFGRIFLSRPAAAGYVVWSPRLPRAKRRRRPAPARWPVGAAGSSRTLSSGTTACRRT